ncbi:MAG: hypothetical protein ACI9W6_001457 [Motiliproteus sp.]|jgi:hypothetical protein
MQQIYAYTFYIILEFNLEFNLELNSNIEGLNIMAESGRFGLCLKDNNERTGTLYSDNLIHIVRIAHQFGPLV